MNKIKPDKVEIRLNGVGISYKSSIPPSVAAAVLRLCLADRQIDKDEQLLHSDTESVLSGGKISLGEYVHKYEPTSYPEKILTIATFQKEIKRSENFSPDEIRSLFRTIGDVPPANFSRDFRVAISNSWIAQDDKDSDRFYVTNAGMEALKSNFASGRTYKRKKKVKERKKEKKNRIG